jgi:hypothetical protein
VYEGVSYQWVDGVVKDVHSVRPMTDEEQQVIDEAHKIVRDTVAAQE